VGSTDSAVLRWPPDLAGLRSLRGASFGAAASRWAEALSGFPIGASLPGSVARLSDGCGVVIVSDPLADADAGPDADSVCSSDAVSG